MIPSFLRMRRILDFYRTFAVVVVVVDCLWIELAWEIRNAVVVAAAADDDDAVAAASVLVPPVDDGHEFAAAVVASVETALPAASASVVDASPAAHDDAQIHDNDSYYLLVHNIPEDYSESQVHSSSNHIHHLHYLKVVVMMAGDYCRCCCIFFQV